MIDLLLSSLPFLLTLVLSFSSLSWSIQVTSSSPCQSVCAASAVGTIADDIVCLDREFTSTRNGTYFRTCVECELGSTAVDPAIGATDVTWGLFNLRYALSTCLFGVPIEKVSISTPCQVSCTPLQDAISYNLNTNATREDLSYCGLPSFQDTEGINRCAECYGRMDQQDYMANFLQALHIACLQPPRPSEPFPVPANTIFNSTPIATPTPSSTAKPAPQKPANLALIISLPVVFGVLIIAGIVACCFYSARHRRRIMAERNAMRRIHDKMSPTYPPDHPQYYQQQQQENTAQRGFESAPPAEPIYFSPVTDQKENPYFPPISEQPSPPSQAQYPSYRTYTPADYVTQANTLDTALIGPGPDQKQPHTLHDQYFPLPPPPPPPPAQPSLPQEGVESLRQHNMNIPSLAIPVPKKKSVDVQRQKVSALGGAASGLGIGYGHGRDGDHKGAIQLQEYGRRDGKVREQQLRHGENENENGVETETETETQVESPAQVFVYDPVADRYVKENPRG